MKTRTVTTTSTMLMTRLVPLKDRCELSLIFMVAAAVGQVALASRGFPLSAEIVSSMAGGVAFGMLWVIPKLTLRNVARTLILGVVWSTLSVVIDRQVESVMTNPVSRQEVFS